LLGGPLLSRARDWLPKYPQGFLSGDMAAVRAFIAASAGSDAIARIRSEVAGSFLTGAAPRDRADAAHRGAHALVIGRGGEARQPVGTTDCGDTAPDRGGPDAPSSLKREKRSHNLRLGRQCAGVALAAPCSEYLEVLLVSQKTSVLLGFIERQNVGV